MKAIIGNETLTVGCIYNDNKNNIRTLLNLEELLDEIESKQGLVLGGDYNVIVNPQSYKIWTKLNKILPESLFPNPS